MAASKSRFSFNKLPAELRVRIYELVLAKDEDEPFEVQSCVSDDCHRRPTQHTRQYHLPPILHVSRQIRHEAGPVFYNNTPFIATLYNHQSPQKAVNQWLKVIGKNQAKEINNLLIRFPKGGYSWTDEETSNMMEQPGAEDADFFRAVTAFRSVNTLTKRAVCEALQLGKHGLADDKIKVAYEELFGGCEYFE